MRQPPDAHTPEDRRHTDDRNGGHAMMQGSGEASGPHVAGTVELEAGAPPFEGATVRVKLRDVTMADKPAQTVAEQVIDGVSHRATTGRIPFELHATTGLAPDRKYLVEAHVDLNGSGEIEPGDFITMTSHPVAPGPEPTRVDVQVRRIQ